MKPYQKTAGLLDGGISGHLPVKKTPAGCMGCVYRKKLSTNYNDTACHYLLMEGEARRCPVEDCDKYKKKKTAAPSPQKRNGQRKKNITVMSISQPAGKSQQNTWRERHREELLAYQKAYYAANKERIAERQRAYRAAHKEKARAYQKEYRERLKREAQQRKRSLQSCSAKQTGSPAVLPRIGALPAADEAKQQAQSAKVAKLNGRIYSGRFDSMAEGVPGTAEGRFGGSKSGEDKRSIANEVKRDDYLSDRTQKGVPPQGGTP